MIPWSHKAVSIDWGSFRRGLGLLLSRNKAGLELLGWYDTMVSYGCFYKLGVLQQGFGHPTRGFVDIRQVWS